MRLLLTSAGVKNTAIRDALVDLMGKPIAEASALCIPTAQYGHPMVGPGAGPWRFISGTSELPMVGLGWRSVGVLELTALPSIDAERWMPLVRETDVLLVAGGDALYLCHWMRESGLADMLPSMHETVWVGLSAGSMVMAPRVGTEFVQWTPPNGDDTTLGVVDFSICPHLAPDGIPGNTMAEAEAWAAGISGPAYAIDGETAIAVVDGTVRVVSEGQWRYFSGRPERKPGVDGPPHGERGHARACPAADVRSPRHRHAGSRGAGSGSRGDQAQPNRGGTGVGAGGNTPDVGSVGSFVGRCGDGPRRWNGRSCRCSEVSPRTRQEPEGWGMLGGHRREGLFGGAC